MSLIAKSKFWINYIDAIIYYQFISFFFKCKIGGVKVLTIDQTIDDAIRNNYSISRFGDGEIRLINHESIEFQEYSPVLSARLREVLKADIDGHAVCLPDIFSSLVLYRSEAQYFWKLHLRKFYLSWVGEINTKKYYYNSFVTRPYITFENRKPCSAWFEKLKKLWQDRDIVIIEGVHSRLGVGNDLFDTAKSTKRILCPSLNAFAKYDQILANAKLQSRDKLLLIALGPTATVLAYDLFLEGFQALDIGHVDIEYEWFLMQADWKVNIPSKHTNEASSMLPADDIVNQKYKEEVLIEI